MVRVCEREGQPPWEGGRAPGESESAAETEAEVKGSEGEVEELSDPWVDCEEESAGDEAQCWRSGDNSSMHG